MVVLGGVTRLTESGLSITEWKPLVGVIPPLSEADWQEEFEKYKQFPEYKKYVESGAEGNFTRIKKLSAPGVVCIF
jgi:cytochrome c oxidase assembly protein subunit 15